MMCPLKLFYCYAHEDRPFRAELNTHLALLERQQLFKSWFDGEIKAGAVWEQEINQHLSTSHLIVLFVSADFFNSDYCYHHEMKRALERHKIGTARVIPIIVRPVYWENAPFAKLQVLPPEAKPVSTWQNRDEVWYEIARQIAAVAVELQKTITLTKEKWFKDGSIYLHSKDYKEALTTYEHIIQVDLTSADAHIGKGKALFYLRQYN
jgi:tetratricopeptide (TPR) repeat protein